MKLRQRWRESRCCGEVRTSIGRSFPTYYTISNQVTYDVSTETTKGKHRAFVTTKRSHTPGISLQHSHQEREHARKQALHDTPHYLRLVLTPAPPKNYKRLSSVTTIKQAVRTRRCRLSPALGMSLATTRTTNSRTLSPTMRFPETRSTRSSTIIRKAFLDVLWLLREGQLWIIRAETFGAECAQSGSAEAITDSNGLRAAFRRDMDEQFEMAGIYRLFFKAEILNVSAYVTTLCYPR